MELIDKLNLLKGSVSTQEIVPILSHFCFTGDEIIAFDGVQVSRIDHDSDFVCGLPAQLLMKLLAGYKGNTLKFEVEEDAVIIKSGRSRTKLVSLPRDSFLYKPQAEDESSFYNFGDDFITGIKKCLVSITEDVTSSQVGVTVITTGGKTTLYSTNGVAISRFVLENGFGSEDFKSFIPLKFCQQLLTYNATLKGSDLREISFSDSGITINFDGGHLFTSLGTKTDFLEFEAVLQGLITQDVEVFAVPDDLESILDRCILMNTQDSPSVSVSCHEDIMSIKTSSRYGDVDENVRLECVVKDIDFDINAILLKKILPTISELSIAMHGKAPVVIGRDSNYINILMSMSKG